MTGCSLIQCKLSLLYRKALESRVSMPFLSAEYVTAFVVTLTIGATTFQAPTENLPLLGLGQQTTPVNQTEIVVARTSQEKANLDRFDELDFDGWNNRNWTLFRELHSPDVLVVDFSGNTTRGIDQHVEWAMAAVSFSPESKVLAHPIKIAAGNWTAVTGTLPGNSTMITLAHWENGRIAEEYLFSN
jgi:SnoaL-like domain